MQSKTTLEEAYDTVAGDYSITTDTYSDDYITIDMNDLDMDINMTDFSVTSISGAGNLASDFVINTVSNITLNTPWEDFCDCIGIDRYQSVEDFRDMCKRYPSLQKALEQFTNTYNIVKDDWHTERNR